MKNVSNNSLCPDCVVLCVGEDKDPEEDSTAIVGHH